MGLRDRSFFTLDEVAKIVRGCMPFLGRHTDWGIIFNPFTAGGAKRRPPGRPRMSLFGDISKYCF